MNFQVFANTYGKNTCGSKSYCLVTTGGAPLEVVKQYIENQGSRDDMLRAYKYRLYPNSEQKEYFAKTFGCSRLIYNLM